MINIQKLNWLLALGAGSLVVLGLSISPQQAGAQQSTPTATGRAVYLPIVGKDMNSDQTPVPFVTNTPTKEATNTATATSSPTATASATATNTNTPSPTATMTATPTTTPTMTATPTMTPTNTPSPTPTIPPDPFRIINAPYLPHPVATPLRVQEMGMTWFGKIDEANNYTDVRVGYDDNVLRVWVSVIERYLWFDTTPIITDLTQWDAATIYLQLNNQDSSQIGSDDYKFVGQADPTGQSRFNYQAAYQGNNTTWQPNQSLTFTTDVGSWGTFNSNSLTKDDSGWKLDFSIPFTALGLTERPANDTAWRMAIAIHDRDKEGATVPITTTYWPLAATADKPSTWGHLWFNPTPYTYIPPQPQTQPLSVTLQHGVDNVTVVDAAVGDGINCGQGMTNLWTEWGNKNYAFEPLVTIQNQAALDVWPCMSKYYITFPLDSVPMDKILGESYFTLWQQTDITTQGNDSWMEVFVVQEDWSENSITWNNAPIPVSNAKRTAKNRWVPAVNNPPNPSGVERGWDMSSAMNEAYTNNDAVLRLAVYTPDRYSNNGKTFATSDNSTVNARPFLRIFYYDKP